MGTFVGEGKAIDFTPTVDVPAGTVLVYGGRVTVTKRDIAANELGARHMTGIWDFPKAAGVGEGIDDEAVVYWDDTAKVMTETSAGNTEAGIVIQDSSDDDTTVRVRLNW